MSAINNIIYHNAVKVNGISYDLKIKTPDAKIKADSARITDLFKAILCSNFNVDTIEGLSFEQLTTKLEYTPDEGAKIASGETSKKIQKKFLETLKGSDYQGTKVEKSQQPTIADAIETIYDIQTSARISGPINSSYGNWMLNGAGSLISRAGSGAASGIKSMFSLFGSKSFEESMKEPENVEHLKGFCSHLVRGDDPSAEDKTFYDRCILPYIKRKIPKGTPIKENIPSEFIKVVRNVNKNLESRERVNIKRLTKAITKKQSARRALGMDS